MNDILLLISVIMMLIPVVWGLFMLDHTRMHRERMRELEKAIDLPSALARYRKRSQERMR